MNNMNNPKDASMSPITREIYKSNDLLERLHSAISRVNSKTLSVRQEILNPNCAASEDRIVTCDLDGLLQSINIAIETAIRDIEIMADEIQL